MKRAWLMREGIAPSRIRPLLGQPVSPIRISLSGECHRNPLPDVDDMRGRVFGADRKILPIGQDVRGDEIDLGGDFAVAQPEFPDVGVTDRRLYARLDRTDGFPEVGDGHFPPQQHFAADDDRRHGVGMLPSTTEIALSIEQRVLDAVASEPDRRG